ncbi:hypothetical protein [Calothrix rhizosoleniae]|uniref:hypothetical protein n=1 Tax=Calothrix rhizosoleniae TaxID=888997 RepID=UPI000B49D0A9|nr:hypothetical protein [Calothrix rhizosoleniae]
MVTIIKRLPWISLTLLLLTYTHLGWVTYQAGYSLVTWLLLVLAILLLTGSFTTPWSKISNFFRFLLQSNLRYFGFTLLGALLLFFILAKFRLFLDILVMIAATMLARLDFQGAGLNEKLAFGIIFIFSLIGLGLGVIMHLLVLKYMA